MTTENLLSENGYNKSPNYGTYYKDGQSVSIAYPWSPKLRSAKGELNLSDIIIPEEWGYTVIISHGGIICPSDTFIRFPKWATEDTFFGCFERMENFFKQNYEFLPGLSPYSNSWD